MMYKILWCMVTVFITAFRSNTALETTTQIELPIPFSLLEHFYFNPQTRCFIAIGDTITPEKIMQSNLTRRYDLVHISLKDGESMAMKYAPTLLEGTSVFLMEYPQDFYGHFFHLLEHLVGIWALYGHNHNQTIRRIIFAGSNPNQSWATLSSINRHVLNALFPEAKVHSWQEFLTECNHHTVCMERVLISDRGLSIYHPACAKINKHLANAAPYITATHMDALAEAVYTYTGVHRQQDTQHIHVTYIKRPPPRCLTESVESPLIKKISAIPNVLLTVVDFAQISFREQIDIIANTDILLSIHGNGLSHILFLPNNASIIELFPPNTHHLDYRLFSDIRQLDYYGVLYGDTHLLGKERAYQLGSYGLPNAPIDKLKINLVMYAIKNHLQKQSTHR